jgi:methyl-accepting chemotaxis protein
MTDPAPATPAAHIRRTNYLINLPHQRRLMALFFMVYVISLTGMLWYFWDIIKTAQTNHVIDPSFVTYLRFPMIWVVGWIVLWGGIVAWIAVLTSHKIAGPIHSVEKALRALRSGDYTARVRLRQGDEFGHLAEEVNLLAEQLGKTLPR